jgi:hypothetical protein
MENLETPATKPNGDSNPPDPYSFEKFKYKVEILKWFIVSVVLVVITTIIDWGFRDRSSGSKKFSNMINMLLS